MPEAVQPHEALVIMRSLITDPGIEFIGLTRSFVLLDKRPPICRSRE